MAGSSGFVDRPGTGRQWYDLFSRGARDWLRHNDKVRAAVRAKLPELIAGSELLPRADAGLGKAAEPVSKSRRLLD